ncbi:MAG TPA: aminotransferase class I/II-fold pyridoxal phosphate-dependent enzyme, partial [Chloroflexota bacterium]|nr:aminotransferase class I/II-fold pyridoxal phosphate-dependent enzyme [Chloroflexota bacterium]
MRDIASRAAHIGTETAFEMLARARALEAQGRSIVHLEIGEPDFPTPPHIIQAGQQSLGAGETHYVQAAGLPELRRALADHVAESRGVAVDPQQVVVTPGAKPIIFFTILT